MLNLTREERKVIVFLAVVSLLGVTADFFAKKFYSAKPFACLAQDLGKINLNTADKAILMSVPGIGEKIASRIIEYRENKKNFDTPEELRNIKGINGYRYEKMKNHFIVK